MSEAESQAQVRQMLGMKGAQVQNLPKWRLRLQLMKPITWIPLIWGVLCGSASSGGFQWRWEDILKVLTCMLLSGPLMTGYTQTLNDFYDREIDAINEPYRPIPSGAIPLGQVIAQIWLLLLAGLGLALFLDIWSGQSWPVITTIAVIGTFLAFIYSAPPLKLKQNGWLGNYALGASYIALPWCAGHALFGTLNPTIVILTLFYSLAGLGIAVVITVTAVDPEVPFDEEVTQVQGCKYDLNLGLKRQEFVLYYQPVVDVATGATVGFEALVRWQHPIGGLLGPGEFIPLAESSGLMVPLGRWILRRALHQLARWQARLPDWLRLQMHVNVSPLQLTDPGFVSDVADGLQATGLQPQQLVLEITEGVLVGPLAAVHDTLSYLRELGVRAGDSGAGLCQL